MFLKLYKDCKNVKFSTLKALKENDVQRKSRQQQKLCPGNKNEKIIIKNHSWNWGNGVARRGLGEMS